MADIYLAIDGAQTGPYLPGQLRSMLAEGTITAETPAWREGLADWSSVGALLAKVPESSGPPPVPPSALPKPRTAAPAKGMSPGVIAAIVVGVVLVLAVPCCCGIALGPIENGIEKAKENMAVMKGRQIMTAMFAYATDHNGAYPDAASAPAQSSPVTIGNGVPGASTSTEVFQKLLDGKYVSDPQIFYIQMPGKVPPIGDRLMPENVCFDVTAGVTSNSPEGVPLVFVTGFTVNYDNGIKVTRNGVAPFPVFIAAYTGNTAHPIRLDLSQTAVIMPSFDPHGVQYRQLKP